MKKNMRSNLIIVDEETLRELISTQVKEAFESTFSQLNFSYTTDLPRVLDIDAACEFVGIKKSYCYKLTSQNKIPHSKRGKILYFDREKLEKWMLENEVPTLEEIAARVDDKLANMGKAQR